MAIDIYFETLALRPLSFQRKFDRNSGMSDQEKSLSAWGLPVYLFILMALEFRIKVLRGGISF